MNKHYPSGSPRAALPRRPGLPRRAAVTSARMRSLREAAFAPEVDQTKFRDLLQLEERQDARDARIAFDRAFGELQTQLPVIAERGVLPFANGGKGATYALWEDINEAVKPFLGKHGFAMRFRTAQDANSVSVTCFLSHVAGHIEETTVRLPMDFSDGKSGVQAVGSSTSYAKRYAACALLNITSVGEDDDGHEAGRVPSIDPEQLAELNLLIAEVGSDERKLSNLMGVATLRELPLAKFTEAMCALRAKGARP